MFCAHCGKQIPDDSNFCAYCGKAIGTSIQPESEASWEYCQIQFSGKYHQWTTRWSDVKFWAEAIGKSGKYNAGESTPFNLASNGYSANPPYGVKDSDQAKSSKAHEELVAKLLKDGWEPLAERGPEQYALKFRRKIQGGGKQSS